MCLEQFLTTAAAENPNRRLRMMALADRVSMTVERADLDDLVTLVTQAPPWEKDRVQGSRILLRAIGEGKADAPEQILARWTWKLARATRKARDRKVGAEFPEAKRLPGRACELARSPSRGKCGEARQGGARASDRGRRRAPRLRRRLHAESEPPDRRRARGTGALADVAYALAGEPTAAEGADEPSPPPKAQEEGQRPGGSGDPRRASLGRRSRVERPVAGQAPQAAKAAAIGAVLRRRCAHAGACRRGVTPC